MKSKIFFKKTFLIIMPSLFSLCLLTGCGNKNDNIPASAGQKISYEKGMEKLREINELSSSTDIQHIDHGSFKMNFDANANVSIGGTATSLDSSFSFNFDGHVDLEASGQYDFRDKNNLYSHMNSKVNSSIEYSNQVITTTDGEEIHNASNKGMINYKNNFDVWAYSIDDEIDDTKSKLVIAYDGINVFKSSFNDNYYSFDDDSKYYGVSDSFDKIQAQNTIYEFLPTDEDDYHFATALETALAMLTEDEDGAKNNPFLCKRNLTCYTTDIEGSADEGNLYLRFYYKSKILGASFELKASVQFVNGRCVYVDLIMSGNIKSLASGDLRFTLRIDPTWSYNPNDTSMVPDIDNWEESTNLFNNLFGE